MPAQNPATVWMFGSLHLLRRDRGLASVVEVSIPSCGCAASVLARELDLPLASIEVVFVNNQLYCLDHCVQQGDKVVFFPEGFYDLAHGLTAINKAGQPGIKHAR
jgi:hypothetical protein